MTLSFVRKSTAGFTSRSTTNWPWPGCLSPSRKTNRSHALRNRNERLSRRSWSRRSLSRSKEPEAPQPSRAGFMPGSVNPGPMVHAARREGLPRFGQGSPVWRRVDAAFRRGPKPKTAGFVAESTRPRAMAGAIRFQGAPTFKPKSASIASAAQVIKSPQPAASRFLVEQSTAKPSFGKPRPAAGVRLGTITPVTA